MVGPNRSAASRAHPTSAAIAADPESAAMAAARRGRGRAPLPAGLRSAAGFAVRGTASSDPTRPNERLRAQPNTDPAATRFAAAATPVAAASPHSGTSQRAAATEPTSAPSVFAA